MRTVPRFSMLYAHPLGQAEGDLPLTNPRAGSRGGVSIRKTTGPQPEKGQMRAGLLRNKQASANHSFHTFMKKV